MEGHDNEHHDGSGRGSHFLHKIIYVFSTIFNNRGNQQSNFSTVETMGGMMGVEVEPTNHTIVDHHHCTNASLHIPQIPHIHPNKHDGNTHDTHTHDGHTHAAHHAEYQLAEYFARAVEMINTVAGVIVLISVLLVGYNLLLVLSNANLGEETGQGDGSGVVLIV